MTSLMEQVLRRVALDSEDATMELVIRKPFLAERFYVELRCSPIGHIHAKGEGATIAEALALMLLRYGAPRPTATEATR